MAELVASFVTHAPRAEPRLERYAGAAVVSRPMTHRPASGSAPRVSATGAHPSQRCVRPADSDTAQRFADVTLRLVLEVIDGRRVPATLASSVQSGPLGLVGSIARGALPLPGRGLGSARLHRVKVHRIEEGWAEIFGSYCRGARHFAIAGRIEDNRHGGWRLTALQLG